MLNLLTKPAFSSSQLRLTLLAILAFTCCFSSVAYAGEWTVKTKTGQLRRGPVDKNSFTTFKSFLFGSEDGVLSIGGTAIFTKSGNKVIYFNGTSHAEMSSQQAYRMLQEKKDTASLIACCDNLKGISNDVNRWAKKQGRYPNDLEEFMDACTGRMLQCPEEPNRPYKLKKLGHGFELHCQQKHLYNPDFKAACSASGLLPADPK